MTAYQTVLFDLDGTIIDTNELIMQSFMYTLELHYPGQYTRDDLVPHMGDTLYNQLALFGPDRVEELVATYREHNATVHDRYVKEFPFVKETISELHQQGIRMGVVTTKMRRTAQIGLASFGLDRFMDAFICYDDVKKHKPHPEPVLKAIDLLGADPQRTLMVGDSKYDIQAAKGAGIAAAAVGWSMQGPEYLKQFAPDYLITDMRDLLEIVRKGTER